MILKRGFLIKILSFLLAFAILCILIGYIGTDKFVSTLEKIPIWFFLLAIVAYAISWYIRIKRTHLFIQPGDLVSDFSLFKILIAGYALNILLPAKLGDVASIGFLTLRGLTLESSFVVILQSRIMDVFGLICATIPAFCIYLYIIPSWVTGILLIGGFLVFIPHALILLYSDCTIPEWISESSMFKIHHKVRVVFRYIQTVYKTYSTIVLNKRIFVTSAGLSVIIWILEGLTCYILSFSLTPDITVVMAIFAVSIANLGKMVPATPGSIGIFETVLSGILIIFGVPSSIAVTIAIIDHLLKNSFVMLIGMPFASSLGFHLLERDKISAILSTKEH